LKLLTFSLLKQPGPRLGVLINPQLVLDIASWAASCEGQPVSGLASMLALLQAGAAGMTKVRQLVAAFDSNRHAEFAFPIAQIDILAPLPRPVSIRDCMSFEQHLLNCTRTVVGWRSPTLVTIDRLATRYLGRRLLRTPAICASQPIYYKGNPLTVVGHNAEVVWPAYENKLDFELEFGVFIGAGGVNISVEQAEQHIGGYSLFNDFSARETQIREMAGRLGPAKGKDFDTGNVIGPYLVTPDEIPDARELRFTASVNGEEWSNVTAGDMQFSVAEIISYISQSETLHPGEFIAVGTLPGGCGLELNRWIQPGDTVEIACPQLGILRNRVVAARAA